MRSPGELASSTMIPFTHRLLAGLLLLASAAAARAELKTLEIHQREPYANGMSFGNTGPYERLQGVARFAIDPAHIRNLPIVDLGLAPKNSEGKVEFASDVYILKPRDPAKGNGAILYDVNNRGNRLALRFFNLPLARPDPAVPPEVGDGFLFRRGYTVVWCGWIGELLAGDDRLLLQAPIATEDGRPIRGLVRYEMVTDSPAPTLPLSRREGHGSHPPTPLGEKEGTLTVRNREKGDRQTIPRQNWSLERREIPRVEKGVSSTLGQVRCKLEGGFQPGMIYELICEAEGPIVQGCGYAAVRDLLSFLRHDSTAQNPLRDATGKPVISRVHGFGVSQSGRFLRNFTYLGFNLDEKERKVFDGLMPHVAGAGLGFFNHRFAQPTRHNGQHEEHLYPCDYFPFTYGDTTDPFSERTDGILRKLAREAPQALPRVMHTQGTGEYWNRCGSLVHTDPRGRVDVELPDNVRIYTFGGTQHGPAADPPQRGAGQNLPNPGDYKPFLRALLDALDAWVRDGAAPPPSVYPRIDNGTLVDWDQKSTGFPNIPGVAYPAVIQQPHSLDYGPLFETRGIITFEPPKVRGDYVVLTPRCGPDGNELGTLLPPEVAVPLATYTGWNLRKKDIGASDALASLMGSYVPFPRTAAERKAAGDPRLSIEERYGSFERYRQQFSEKCAELVKQRYLLPDDADRLIAGREKVKASFPR